MNQIESIIIKHGEFKELPQKVSIAEGAYLEVPESDNGILLIVEAAEGGYITIKAGDSVLAGSDITYWINTGMNVFLLESGRHLFTKGEKKGQIHVDAASHEMYAWVVELI